MDEPIRHAPANRVPQWEGEGWLPEPRLPACGIPADGAAVLGTLDGLRYVECQDCIDQNPDVAAAVEELAAERRRYAAERVLKVQDDSTAKPCPGCTTPGPHQWAATDGTPDTDEPVFLCPGIGATIPGTHTCEDCEDAQPFKQPYAYGWRRYLLPKLSLAGSITVGNLTLNADGFTLRGANNNVTAEDLDAWAADRPQSGRTCGDDSCPSGTCAADAEPEWTPGDVAEVLCSDGEWRPATCSTRNGGATLVWRFADGLLRRVDDSEARPVPEEPQVPEWVANATLRAAGEVIRELQADCVRERQAADEYAGGWSALHAYLAELHNELSVRRSIALMAPGERAAGRVAAYDVATGALMALLRLHTPPWDHEPEQLLPEVEPEAAAPSYVAEPDGTGEGWTPPADAPDADPEPAWVIDCTLDDVAPKPPPGATGDLLGTRKRRRRAQIIAGPSRTAPTTTNIVITGGPAASVDALSEAMAMHVRKARKMARR